MELEKLCKINNAVNMLNDIKSVEFFAIHYGDIKD